MPSKPRGGRPTPRSRTKADGRGSGALRGGAPAQERELRAQGRKTMRRLLDAGRLVFERRGFHAARVDDIVKAAKTSHGTFYLYFSNKEDLFKALALDAIAEMAALGEQLGPVTPDEAGRAALREWVGKFVDTYSAHGNVIRSWTEGEISDNDLGQQGRDLLLQLSGAIARRIKEAGVANGSADGAGVACLSMIERFNYFMQTRQVHFDRDEAVETLTRAAFTGFFTPETAAEPVRRRRAGARG